MQGIEVLSTFEYATKYGWNVCLLLVLLTITALAAFAAYVVLNEEITMVIICGGLFISVIVSSPVFGSNPTAYETRYKIIIDDTVSLNEFFETYEIVDQDGKIYTVREIKDGE